MGAKTSFCNYCGNKVGKEQQFCTECGNKLIRYGEKTTSFWMMLLLGPSITWILLFLRCIEGYVRWKHPVDLLTLAFTKQIFFSIIPIVLVLIVFRIMAIPKNCVDYKDALIWTVLFVLVPEYGSYSNTEISLTTLTFPRQYDIEVFLANGYAHRILGLMSQVWYSVCMVFFLLVRSDKLIMTRKKMKIILLALFLFAIMVFCFSGGIAGWISDDPAVSACTNVLLKRSCIFIWMRFFILLYFVIMLANKHIVYIGAIVSVFVRYVIHILLDYGIHGGDGLTTLILSETIAYFVWGIIIFFIMKEVPKAGTK